MENTSIKYFEIEELGTWPIHTANVEVDEGKQKISQHLERERNSHIVKLAKELFKKKHNGKVFCEICEFEFGEKYGKIGDGFIEAHHKNPISKMKPGDVTRIEDFIMVCSNCHSMLHIGSEWITYEELKLQVNKKK